MSLLSIISAPCQKRLHWLRLIKRVANILAKEATPEGAVVEVNLVEVAEKALYAELSALACGSAFTCCT